MSGMDGARSSNRRNAWSKIHTTCPCGLMIYGNGKSHQRHCKVHLRESGWPLDAGMREALRDDAYKRGLSSTDLISAVERGIGAEYLARREAGNKDILTWRELKDLVWRLADAVSAP